MILLFPLALFILPGAATALFSAAVALGSDAAFPRRFLPGIALGTVAWVLLASRLKRLLVLEHETTHALAAVLFLRRVTGFSAGADGGQVTHRGGFGGAPADHLIGLAPYYLPAVTLLLVLPRSLVPPAHLAWYDTLIAASWSMHLLHTAGDIGANWTKRKFAAVDGRHQRTDIGRRGYVASGVVIASLAALIHAAIFRLLLDGWPGMLVLGSDAWTGSLEAWGPPAKMAARWILELINKG